MTIEPMQDASRYLFAGYVRLAVRIIVTGIVVVPVDIPRKTGSLTLLFGIVVLLPALEQSVLARIVVLPDVGWIVIRTALAFLPAFA